MRRIISFILALSLTAAGVVALIFLLAFAEHWRGWMFMAAGLMFVAGGAWLYSDFIDATPNEKA
jgi:hypothetical protein